MDCRVLGPAQVLSCTAAVQEKGNQCALSWAVRIKEELGSDWAKVGLRQLSGLLCLVFGRQAIMVRESSSLC